jgi:hypothetical protein
VAISKAKTIAAESLTLAGTIVAILVGCVLLVGDTAIAVRNWLWDRWNNFWMGPDDGTRHGP